MNQSEAYLYGEKRGAEAAWYTDYDPAIDESWEAAAFESETHSRQFSPFEHFARDVNNTGDRADGIWEAYDRGVAVGIRQYIREHKGE